MNLTASHMTQTNVDVVPEMSASEGEDRPKKKVRGKVVKNESEVENHQRTLISCLTGKLCS